MRRIGYVRISSVDQNPTRQYKQLEEIELISYLKKSYPELHKMLDELQTDDTVLLQNLPGLPGAQEIYLNWSMTSSKRKFEGLERYLVRFIRRQSL